ncbi:hypothetical protein M0802_014303 [Mischocyttarus mexicanus]|nr:hypothetical protein M0802_014303 [Mischocyttarus mexicanus]
MMGGIWPQTSQRQPVTLQTSQQPAPKPQTSQQQPVTLQTSERPSQGHSLLFIPDLSNNCCYCRQWHYLALCPQFNSLSRMARVEVVVGARLCFNCLRRHNVRQCRHRSDLSRSYISPKDWYNYD